MLKKFKKNVTKTQKGMFLKCNIAIHCEQARNDQLEILYIPYKIHFDRTNFKKFNFFNQNRQGPLNSLFNYL